MRGGLGKSTSQPLPSQFAKFVLHLKLRCPVEQVDRNGVGDIRTYLPTISDRCREIHLAARIIITICEVYVTCENAASVRAGCNGVDDMLHHNYHNLRPMLTHPPCSHYWDRHCNLQSYRCISDCSVHQSRSQERRGSHLHILLHNLPQWDTSMLMEFCVGDLVPAI